MYKYLNYTRSHSRSHALFPQAQACSFSVASPLIMLFPLSSSSPPSLLRDNQITAKRGWRPINHRHSALQPPLSHQTGLHQGLQKKDGRQRGWLLTSSEKQKTSSGQEKSCCKTESNKGKTEEGPYKGGLCEWRDEGSTDNWWCIIKSSVTPLELSHTFSLRLLLKSSTPSFPLICIHLFPFLSLPTSMLALHWAYSWSYRIPSPHWWACVHMCTYLCVHACLPDLLILLLVIASSLHICAMAGVCRRVWLPRMCAFACVCVECITDTESSINIVSSGCSPFSFSGQHLQQDPLVKKRVIFYTYTHPFRPISKKSNWLIIFQ